MGHMLENLIGQQQPQGQAMGMAQSGQPNPAYYSNQPMNMQMQPAPNTGSLALNMPQQVNSGANPLLQNSGGMNNTAMNAIRGRT